MDGWMDAPGATVPCGTDSPADLDSGDVERDQLHLADVERAPELRRLGRDDAQVQRDVSASCAKFTCAR